MIIFKELRWGNAFSYGPSNSVRLDANPLTQLIGKNGHGKSSIALVLEEVLFNTNSKKIKKGDILNRYTKDKSYFIELDFSKDGKEYNITTKRSSTSTTTLVCDGVDISSHTATGTYKQIEEIIGFDHKAFSQIVYQSSISSLEFLTATDTARKKFLIELLNLSHYTRANEVFKEIAASTSKSLDIAQAKVDVVTSWLKKHEGASLEIIELVDEPEAPTEALAKITAIESSIANIVGTNKKIIQNNKYKELLDAIIVQPWNSPPLDRNYYNDIVVQLSGKVKEFTEGRGLSAKCKGPTTKCPTCSQDVDNSTMFSMATRFEEGKATLEAEIAELKTKVTKFEASEKEYSAHQKTIAEYEKYHALYDPTIPTETLDIDKLNKDLSVLEAEVLLANKGIAIAKKHNANAVANNTKVELLSKQLEDYRGDRVLHQAEVDALAAELSDLQVLVKAFSTTGLVAYKIECLVKDLEEITNQYLATLAGGRFQLSFQITSSDKLNVVITDNGRDISIDALSNGERARVNVSTLLAIRKLMQALSNSRTNLLILDETVEGLDAEGKEKLVEVLLEETSLNTFLVSHGFTHPLLEKISVVKEHNVSRIE